MSIKKKLGLYGTSTPESRAAPKLETIDFGDHAFTELAPFVFERFDRTANPSYGTQNIQYYLPFRVSGILDLALVKHVDAIHPEELLFLDTETTGLSRGTGTFPFLVGLAFLRGETLVTRQLLLTSPAGEAAFLEAIQGEIRAHSFLVTYNGKSFDIPLLATRLILQRDRLAAPVFHFDLLHILRRLFPHRRLGSYRQGDLERELLNASREGDITGAQIPQIYFDYVKYGTDTGMESIVHHNHLDLLGMVFLFLESVRVYTEKDASRGTLRSGIARLLARNHRYAEAMDLAAEVSHIKEELSTDRNFLYRDALFRAWLERKTGEYAKAAASFLEISERCQCPYSRLALARILEHKLGKPEEALIHTRKLLEIASDQEDRSDLIKREQRLLRKIRPQ
ncbi:MAG: ribonuclease H-like domain-containing protein [Spirochaetia bacterium]|nr:ribonuclease H-like domain-containing protein [Spirochaetia bacterium]